MSTDSNVFQRNAMSAFVQIAAVVLIVSWCFIIVRPFIGMVVWALVIAVAIYPIHLTLAAKIGDRAKTSATLFVLLGLTILLVPSYLFAESSIAALQQMAAALSAGQVKVPPPDPSVADWPFIGNSVYDLWSSAAANLEETLNKYSDQLQALGAWLVRFAGASLLGVLQFVISIIIAGVFLVSADGGYRVSQTIASNLSEDYGHELVDMSIATIRSVAKGVLGVAIIQAVLSAIGLVAIGVPAAGLWAFLVLILAIIQLPPLIILGPIVVWVFSVNSGTSATIFAIYAIIVSGSDSFLKPMLLGRGLDIPMLVILLGAIGGAMAAGIIGLFIGAVILAVGYTILMAWMSAEDKKGAQDAQASEAS